MGSASFVPLICVTLLCISAGQSKPGHGHLHHHEPGIRGTIELARQSEEAVPQPGYDETGSTTYRSSPPVFASTSDVVCVLSLMSALIEKVFVV